MRILVTGRLLGYAPCDDAEEHADAVPHGESVVIEDAFVGGPFATRTPRASGVLRQGVR